MSTIKTRQDLKQYLQNTTCEYTVIKLHANWCAPCKKIGPSVDILADKCKKVHGDDFNYIKIDVDNAMDLFAFFKTKKMLKGIPAVFLYKRSDFDEMTFYIPSEAVLGADMKAINDLFNEIE